MELTKNNCATCRFFDSDDILEIGLCRRYPPQLVLPRDGGSGLIVWPRIKPDGWCGEWQPIIESDKQLRRN